MTDPKVIAAAEAVATWSVFPQHVLDDAPAVRELLTIGLIRKPYPGRYRGVYADGYQAALEDVRSGRLVLATDGFDAGHFVSEATPDFALPAKTFVITTYPVTPFETTVKVDRGNQAMRALRRGSDHDAQVVLRWHWRRWLRRHGECTRTTPPTITYSDNHGTDFVMNRARFVVGHREAHGARERLGEWLRTDADTIEAPALQEPTDG